jgi:hypothetical protein
MYASHASPRMPGVCFLLAVPVRGKLSQSLQQRWAEPLLLRKGFPTQSPARQLTDRRIRTQILSRASHWRSGGKANLCRQPATRLTGPISLTCDRYVQYMLTGPTERSLTDLDGGYNLGVPACHIPLPDLSNQLSPLSPNGSARSPI